MSPSPRREPPHRIAFLEPELFLDAADESLRGTAKFLLFVTLFGYLVRHPEIAVVDPDDTALRVAAEGDLVNLSQLHEDDVRRSLFKDDRRDELIWFELPLLTQAAKPDAPVRLRTLAHDGKKESFVALGAQPLSTKLEQCFEQWLAAREKGDVPRPLEAFDRGSFVDVCRRLRTRIRLPDVRPRRIDPRAALEPVPEEPSPDEVPPEDLVVRGPPNSLAELEIELPPVLAVPFLRVIAYTSGLDLSPFILAIDQDDPWALRDRFFANLQKGRDFDLLRRLAAVAPGWGKPYLSWHRAPGDTQTRKKDDGFDEDDKLHAYAAGALRIPGNHWALGNYAYELDEKGRLPEAVRYRRRALVAAGYGPEAYVNLIGTERRLGRPGAHVRVSATLARDLEQRLGDTADRVPEMIRAKLAVADAWMAVGRHAEAVALREDVLRGHETRWPRELAKLERWRKDPSELAQAYAYEGHFRGDPGRVVEGLSAVSPHGWYGFQARALMRAFVSLGKPELARLAWAHLQAQRSTQFGATRLEAARALLLAGDLDRAMREVLLVSLSYPQHGYETTIHRLLRLSAASGKEAWGVLVGKELARGAKTVARLLARDAADFVPGAADVEVIARALGERRPMVFETSSLEPMHKYLSRDARIKIDTIFGAPRGILADADALVDGWTVTLHHGEVSDETAASELAYVAAQAIARYLAATTSPPSPGTGALRVVATEALAACSLLSASLPDEVVVAFLEVMESAAGAEGQSPACDEWTFDTWLLRVERAFGIEDRYSGRLSTSTRGLMPKVTALLRGDERVAAEYRMAHELAADKPEGWSKAASVLLARVFRAGGQCAHAWSDAAVSGLSPEEALDVQFLCLAAPSGHATPSVNAAKLLLEAGRPGEAVEALKSGIGFAGANWRKERLAEIAPLWEKAKVDVPFDWKRCNSEGSAALQKGNLARAIQCLSWCGALDPDNHELWRNLGIAYAQDGDDYEAVRAFARFDDATEGVKLAGLVLCQAKHAKEGLAVLDYISRWFTRAEDHRYHALFAWQAGDDPAMLRAYGRAWRMDPAALNGVDLNGYAGVLYEAGEYAESERVTKRLELVAGSDPELRGCALHCMACADIGFERWDEAIAHAKEALLVNPSDVRRPFYEKTLARAERRERMARSVSPPAPVTLVQDALEEGDFRTVLGNADSADWRIRHAALLASDFRYETENGTGVTPRARAASEWVLRDSRGATDSAVVLARIEALRIRENALFSLDPPPPLGDRLTRDQFRRELARRSGLPEPVALRGALPPDVELSAGAPITRASQYAELLRALQRKDPTSALASRGLDLEAYERVCLAWAEALAHDPALARAVEARMASGDAP
jgi:tetratricopeptide (TPR) repeat protein